MHYHLKVIKEFEIVPWKNGKGRSYEIDCDGQSPWQWRLSLAEIPVGKTDFSVYQGFDRVLLNVSNVSFDLSINGASRTVRSGDKVAFYGGATVSSSASQTGCFDLGLIYRSEYFRADIQPIVLQNLVRSFSVKDGQFWICAINAVVRIECFPGGKQFRLKPNSALCLTSEGQEVVVSVLGQGLCVMASLETLAGKESVEPNWQ